MDSARQGVAVDGDHDVRAVNGHAGLGRAEVEMGRRGGAVQQRDGVGADPLRRLFAGGRGGVPAFRRVGVEERGGEAAAGGTVSAGEQHHPRGVRRVRVHDVPAG
ncbi:MAG: hypothetical protein AUI14_00230 [Actinobacteria bacterium 13_2_20CM_2_71_6]|nr:MAG: hypothetical protein AUI14_00230 [Actinobacteria bacterium 13_2_20CM_2_71_6]